MYGIVDKIGTVMASGEFKDMVQKLKDTPPSDRYGLKVKLVRLHKDEAIIHWDDMQEEASEPVELGYVTTYRVPITGTCSYQDLSRAAIARWFNPNPCGSRYISGVRVYEPKDGFFTLMLSEAIS